MGNAGLLAGGLLTATTGTPGIGRRNSRIVSSRIRVLPGTSLGVVAGNVCGESRGGDRVAGRDLARMRAGRMDQRGWGRAEAAR
jgi:hypothetical protein